MQHTLRRWEVLAVTGSRDQSLEPRRIRINPRVVKHQVSNYGKGHPHHRPVPPLRKTFLEGVVMLV
jgi:hypothetical protein